MRVKAVHLHLDDITDDRLQDVIGELVEGFYPNVFHEEFPKEKFYEKN